MRNYIMEQVLNQMNQQINSELKLYDQKFRVEHKDMLDFGTCGSAVVLISFGRKRKIKEQFQEFGVTSEHTWPYYGKQCSVVKLPRQGVGTQYIGYYEDRAKIVRDTIKQYFPELDVFVHSWVD